MLLFLVTPCLVVAVQPCMEWISILKKSAGVWDTDIGFIQICSLKSNSCRRCFSAISKNTQTYTCSLLERDRDSHRQTERHTDRQEHVEAERHTATVLQNDKNFYHDTFLVKGCYIIGKSWSLKLPVNFQVRFVSLVYHYFFFYSVTSCAIFVFYYLRHQ